MQTNDELARKSAELDQLNAELEQRVRERTAELEAANKELEAFSHSVSHDLRAPLRSVQGFAAALEEDYGEQLDTRAKSFLARMSRAVENMDQLIDNMLHLAGVRTSEMRREAVDLSALAGDIAMELQQGEPERKVEFIISPGISANGDEGLLRIALHNLLSNAWKFTKDRQPARIELGTTTGTRERAYYVRDNGAGFDMAHVNKLFMDFQRLHGASEYPGTGIGLAIARRVISRHGGRIWAEGATGEGAIFYFTVGVS